MCYVGCNFVYLQPSFDIVFTMKKLSEQAKHNLILSQFTAGLSPSVIAKKFKDIVGCSTVSRIIKDFKATEKTSRKPTS